MSSPRMHSEHFCKVGDWQLTFFISTHLQLPSMPVCPVLLGPSHNLLMCPLSCHSCHSHSCFLSVTADSLCIIQKKKNTSLAPDRTWTTPWAFDSLLVDSCVVGSPLREDSPAGSPYALSASSPEQSLSSMSSPSSRHLIHRESPDLRGAEDDDHHTVSVLIQGGRCGVSEDASCAPSVCFSHRRASVWKYRLELWKGHICVALFVCPLLYYVWTHRPSTLSRSLFNISFIFKLRWLDKSRLLLKRQLKMKHFFVFPIYHRSAATVLTVMKKYELGRVPPEDTDDMGKSAKKKNGRRVQH